MRSAYAHRPSLAGLALALCCLWLAGCAGTQLQKVVHEDSASPNGYLEISDPRSGMLRVFRDGKALALKVPLPLQEGDEIETGPNAGAVIRFENGNKAVLDSRTRVRLGSLEVLFGRLLADVRGLFSAEDDTLVAGVEGTRFLFESKRGSHTRVVVLDGIVNCSSKTNSWPTIRMTRADALTAPFGSSAEPHTSQIDRAELTKIERWASAIQTAPRAGFCCTEGKVSRTHSDSCPSHFSTTRRGAERQCEAGWCCANGQVDRSIRAACRGRLHASRQSAKRDCAAPPPAATGWCCAVGRVQKMDKAVCKRREGRFYTDAAAATAACKRAGYPAPTVITPNRFPAPHPVPVDIHRRPTQPTIK